MQRLFFAMALCVFLGVGPSAAFSSSLVRFRSRASVFPRPAMCRGIRFGGICRSPGLDLRPRALPFLRLAASVGEEGNVEEAIKRCQDAVAKNPDNEDAWFLLGVLLQETGELEMAMEAFSKSTVLNPSREESWLNLAYLQRVEAPSSAVAACMGALKANPKSHRAYTLLGDAMSLAGRQDAALQAYSAAIKAEPTDAASAAHYGLVKALLADGSLDSARLAAERGVKACPDQAVAHIGLGLAMLELGRNKDAIRSLDKAISIDGGIGDAHNAMGVVLRREGKSAAAEESYGKAAELMPNSAEPYYNMAVLQTETRQNVKAIESLKKALAISPLDRRCLTMLASLTGTGHSISELPPGHVQNLFDSISDAYEVAIVPGVGYTGVQSLASAAIACGVPITKPAPSVGGNAGGDVRGEGVEKNMARAAGGMLRQSGMGDIFGDGLQGGGRRAGAGGGGLAIADIGCGTGLCGEAFAMAAGGGGRLVGCDVSSRMSSKAREKGVYDQVEQCDASKFLATFGGGQLDVITAADVLPYMGDLSTLFRAASSALKSGGLFVFTTEEMGGGQYPNVGFCLNQYTRFCHSEEYMELLAAEHGMVVEHSSPCALRLQGTSPVPARSYALRRQ